MDLKTRLKNIAYSALSFTVPATTCLTLLFYAAIFISSVVQEERVPTPPPHSDQHGLDLQTALRDLQIIASGPHPYNSHANDAVHSHIISRLTQVTGLHNNVHIANDLQSNATWYSGNGIYFEGNNVLVKIDGRQPELDAVLFSAHFDSVSTAPGATDDGMGVATLLQLVEYFANNTPRRTVVFNINNGEEDGLHGAHAFLEHPWSSLPKTFLNLEGAGAGGRAVLFRTSSTSVTKAFRGVPHPFGSVLSADGFSLGLIKSGTDYSVYQAGGMRGLDLAFYKRRSLYHTNRDSVPSLEGPNPLWNMMESALFAGIALTEGDSSSDDKGSAVYFDLFGETLVVFSLRTAFIISVVLLVVGPLLVSAGIAAVYVQGKLHWSFRGWLRFPLTIAVGLGLLLGLAALYNYVNPNIVYSSHYTVAISFMALAFASVHIPLLIFSSWHPVPQQKSIILLESYIIWWILLVYNTILINQYQIGGLYVIFFFHISYFLALVVTLAELLQTPPTEHTHSSNIHQHNSRNGGQINGDDTETTPLLRRPENSIERDIQEGEHFGFWTAEFLLLVPFPAILVTQMGLMLLGALSQTLADGSPAITVYGAMALLSFLIVLPLSPFIHKLHRYVSVGFLSILIITGIYCLVAFPFSQTSPLKVKFSQVVDLDNGSNVVNLDGLAGYMKESIVSSFPSTWNQKVNCTDVPGSLQRCQWSGLSPSVVPHNSEDWLSFNATLAGPGAALIKIKGENTRSCRIYFDHPVNTIRIEDTSGEVQTDYPFPREGIKRLNLWSRKWGKEFVVTATWSGSQSLSGRVSCGWAEITEGRIPAFAEILAFLPNWVGATKSNDALVEAFKVFSV
ncbi:Zn-dependent exopeptidase [Hysterangium stoloniferum]|nr:Zn-dependent exopeptidase [Hysterangium stoloniferum]